VEIDYIIIMLILQREVISVS